MKNNINNANANHQYEFIPEHDIKISFNETNGIILTYMDAMLAGKGEKAKAALIILENLRAEIVELARNEETRLINETKGI